MKIDQISKHFKCRQCRLSKTVESTVRALRHARQCRIFSKRSSDSTFSLCAFLSTICGEHLWMAVRPARKPAICGLFGMLCCGWHTISLTALVVGRQFCSFFATCLSFLVMFSASDMVVHAAFTLLPYHIDASVIEVQYGFPKQSFFSSVLAGS